LVAFEAEMNARVPQGVNVPVSIIPKTRWKSYSPIDAETIAPSSLRGTIVR
jgi:hypothetical protein